MSFIITMTAILILCVFLQVLNILNDLLKNSLHVWRALTGLQKTQNSTSTAFSTFQTGEPVLISDIPPQSHLWTKA